MQLLQNDKGYVYAEKFQYYNNNNTIKIIMRTLLSVYHSPGVVFNLLPSFPTPQGQWSHLGAGAGVTVSHQHLESSTRRDTMFILTVSSSCL